MTGLNSNPVRLFRSRMIRARAGAVRRRRSAAVEPSRERVAGVKSFIHRNDDCGSLVEIESSNDKYALLCTFFNCLPVPSYLHLRTRRSRRRGLLDFWMRKRAKKEKASPRQLCAAAVTRARGLTRGPNFERDSRTQRHVCRIHPRQPRGSVRRVCRHVDRQCASPLIRRRQKQGSACGHIATVRGQRDRALRRREAAREGIHGLPGMPEEHRGR